MKFVFPGLFFFNKNFEIYHTEAIQINKNGLPNSIHFNLKQLIYQKTEI